MSRAQSPVRAQSPSYTTDELLVRVLHQLKTLTISFNALKKENENRIDEISRLSKKLGGAGTVEKDSESSNDQKQQTIILRSKKKHSKEKKHLDQDRKIFTVNHNFSQQLSQQHHTKNGKWEPS